MDEEQANWTHRPGDFYREKGRKARVEGVGSMHAFVYYGRGDFRVVQNRPIFYTSNDLIVKNIMVHRCGTEVKYYQQGYPPIDDILLSQLGCLIEFKGDFESSNLGKYANLLEMGESDPNLKDEFYRRLAEYLDSLPESQRNSIRENFFPAWGRVVGHEVVGVIEKVGSNVRNLTKPLGYLSTQLKRIPRDYLDFREGEKVILQPRCARYKLVRCHRRRRGVVGVQLLGSNIEDVSRSLDGGYAQCIRVTPELIQTGCIIRVPDGVSDAEAALVEPTACLVDCLDLATHPEGQDEKGNIMKKGVSRDGVTAILGSGAMAFIAAEVVLTFDEKMQVGGASQVIMFARSQEKADLGNSLLGSKFRDRVKFFIYDSSRSQGEITEELRREYGASFIFDDVIIAAGDVRAVELAHRIVSGTGWRIHAFAGTRGNVTVESGVWHYSNAGTSGTSGCNTKAMENVLGMIERGTIELSRFSGNRYTFKDLQGDPSRFFTDNYLRPALLPNEGVPEVEWHET